MIIHQRASDISEELAERRQLLREYKSLDEFIRRSQEITKKYQDKVEEKLSL